MSRVKTILLTVALVVLIAAGAGLLVLYTGAYNVAATESHWGITQWALSTLQHNSVEARAGDVAGAVPTDSAAVAHGFEHFHAMCVQCHGAPGYDRGELGQGITPEPPRLEEEAHEWSDAGLFWITKHGIRLAGMPAFGPTHSDEEIWGLVAAMRQVEEMSPEQYSARIQALGLGGGESGESGAAGATGDGGHTHPPGTPQH